VFRIIRQSPEKNIAVGLLDRLDPFEQLGIFAGETSIPFEDIVRRGATILLGRLPTDELQLAVGLVFLNKLWYHIKNLGETDQPRFYLVLDEAHRLAFPGSPVDDMSREARKYGVGIIAASQRPRDFTDTVPANAACKFAFSCGLDADRSFMARQIGCQPRDIEGLGPTFEALVKFDYESSPRRTVVVPHFQRVGGN